MKCDSCHKVVPKLRACWCMTAVCVYCWNQDRHERCGRIVSYAEPLEPLLKRVK